MKNNKITIKIKNTRNIKKNKKIIIVKKKHENVFINWLRPNYLLLPPKNGRLEDLGGGGAAAPTSPPWPVRPP